MIIGIYFFRLGKFSIIFNDITGPLSYKSSLSSIPIMLGFDLLIVSPTSWIIWVRSFLCFEFSLTICQCLCGIFYPWDSVFYLLYSVHDPWVYDSFIGFLSQGVAFLCDAFIVFISIFRSWLILFNSFTYFVDFCVSS